MRKKCEKCGEEFEARETYHKYCRRCMGQPAAKVVRDVSEFLLTSYHDAKGNLLKEVYIDQPKTLSEIFANDRLAIKQLRDFHQRIQKARNKALLKGIEAARHLLYECRREVEYQLKRGVIPSSFAQFMKHHLQIAEKNDKSLEGFFQHIDSIVCYFPIK